MCVCVCVDKLKNHKIDDNGCQQTKKGKKKNEEKRKNIQTLQTDARRRKREREEKEGEGERERGIEGTRKDQEKKGQAKIYP